MSPVPSATSPMPHPYGSSQYSIEELAFEEDGPRHAVLMIRGNFMCQQVGTTIPELMFVVYFLYTYCGCCRVVERPAQIVVLNGDVPPPGPTGTSDYNTF